MTFVVSRPASAAMSKVWLPRGAVPNRPCVGRCGVAPTFDAVADVAARQQTAAISTRISALHIYLVCVEWFACHGNDDVSPGLSSMFC